MKHKYTVGQTMAIVDPIDQLNQARGTSKKAAISEIRGAFGAIVKKVADVKKKRGEGKEILSYLL